METFGLSEYVIRKPEQQYSRPSDGGKSKGKLKNFKEFFFEIYCRTEVKILICSHMHRDKRCGVTAPLLKDEFDKILKDKGLDVESCADGIAVYMTSHIGGKYYFKRKNQKVSFYN